MHQINSFVSKAACSSDAGVAKTSVEILRSIISHVLQEQPEPRHFHFNEALFKPFEHLLCRESCDADLQDQVHRSRFRTRFPLKFTAGSLVGNELFVRARRLLEQRNPIGLAPALRLPAPLAAAAAGRGRHLLLEPVNPLGEH